MRRTCSLIMLCFSFLSGISSFEIHFSYKFYFHFVNIYGGIVSLHFPMKTIVVPRKPNFGAFPTLLNCTFFERLRESEAFLFCHLNKITNAVTVVNNLYRRRNTYIERCPCFFAVDRPAPPPLPQLACKNRLYLQYRRTKDKVKCKEDAGTSIAVEKLEPNKTKDSMKSYDWDHVIVESQRRKA
jgi:hypothetical protein